MKMKMYTDHVTENHAWRVENIDGVMFIDCPECEAAYPDYFAEMRAARASYRAATTRDLLAAGVVEDAPEWARGAGD